MRNYKQFIAGALVGGILISGGSVLADNSTLPTITNWVKYKFNGVDTALPSNYTTLNYEGHTYVPTRFIAEELGAKVTWDDQTKTVAIVKETQSPIVDDKDDEKDLSDSNNNGTEDENKNENEDSSKDLANFSELPVSKTINGVRVEVYAVEEQREFTKLYVTVKNTTEKRVQLNQGSAYFESELDTYKNSNIRGNVMYWKDTTWFSDMKEDDEFEGFIMLPPIPADEAYGKFYVEVFENGLNQNVMEYDFDIKW